MSEDRCWLCLYRQSQTIFWCLPSSYHFKLVSWARQWVLCTQIASVASRSQNQCTLHKVAGDFRRPNLRMCLGPNSRKMDSHLNVFKICLFVCWLQVMKMFWKLQKLLSLTHWPYNCVCAVTQRTACSSLRSLYLRPWGQEDGSAAAYDQVSRLPESERKVKMTVHLRPPFKTPEVKGKKKRQNSECQSTVSRSSKTRCRKPRAFF